MCARSDMQDMHGIEISYSHRPISCSSVHGVVPQFRRQIGVVGGVPEPLHTRFSVDECLAADTLVEPSDFACPLESEKFM